MKIERSDVVLAALGLAGLAVIFWALFRYYVYRDYAPAPCEAHDMPLTASMGTEWDERILFSARGEPYRLLLTMDAPPADMPLTAIVRHLDLQSVERGASLPLAPDAKALEATPLHDGGIVFVLDDLRLPYEDHRVRGELVYMATDGERRVPFACPLGIKPSSEWRFVPLQILMSIT